MDPSCSLAVSTSVSCKQVRTESNHTLEPGPNLSWETKCTRIEALHEHYTAQKEGRASRIATSRERRKELRCFLCSRRRVLPRLSHGQQSLRATGCLSFHSSVSLMSSQDSSVRSKLMSEKERELRNSPVQRLRGQRTSCSILAAPRQ